MIIEKDLVRFADALFANWLYEKLTFLILSSFYKIYIRCVVCIDVSNT